MAITEAAIGYASDYKRTEDSLNTLRSIARGTRGEASSKELLLIGQIAAFVAWLDDPRPTFASVNGQTDKFAPLIELSRSQEDLVCFYTRDVGVNATTVWRWATGKSRPSGFLGRKLVVEVEGRLAAALCQDALERGLLRESAMVTVTAAAAA